MPPFTRESILATVLPGRVTELMSELATETIFATITEIEKNGTDRFVPRPFHERIVAKLQRENEALVSKINSQGGAASVPGPSIDTDDITNREPVPLDLAQQAGPDARTDGDPIDRAFEVLDGMATERPSGLPINACGECHGGTTAIYMCKRPDCPNRVQGKRMLANVPEVVRVSADGK